MHALHHVYALPNSDYAHPALQRLCRAKKRLTCVLDLLHNKWRDSSPIPGSVWPTGSFALRLHPTPDLSVLAGHSWGYPNVPEQLTVRPSTPKPS